MAKAGAGKVVCRLCKGDHFTAKCPYKDSLNGLDGAGTCFTIPGLSSSNVKAETPPFGGDDTGTPAEPAAAAPAASTGGKYVPPSMRGGGRGPGESMGRPGGSRDDMPTLRVTNISEDTQENDLRDLFGVFGRVARVYVGRDRETGAGKGFAFVSFEEKAVAQKAMEKMHGRGYDNLILNIQWSRTCNRSCRLRILLNFRQSRGSKDERFLCLSMDVLRVLYRYIPLSLLCVAYSDRFLHFYSASSPL